CTSTWAMLMSVPSAKVTSRVYDPSLLDCDDMYIMFSTPLTCCSIGAATVSATTWALAPGYWQVTMTVGGAIGGYIAMGRARGRLLIEFLDLDLDTRPQPLHAGDDDPLARLDPLLDLLIDAAPHAGRPDVAHRRDLDGLTLLVADGPARLVLLLLEDPDRL